MQTSRNLVVLLDPDNGETSVVALEVSNIRSAKRWLKQKGRRWVGMKVLGVIDSSDCIATAFLTLGDDRIEELVLEGYLLGLSQGKKEN